MLCVLVCRCKVPNCQYKAGCWRCIRRRRTCDERPHVPWQVARTRRSTGRDKRPIVLVPRDDDAAFVGPRARRGRVAHVLRGAPAMNSRPFHWKRIYSHAPMHGRPGRTWPTRPNLQGARTPCPWAVTRGAGEAATLTLPSAIRCSGTAAAASAPGRRWPSLAEKGLWDDIFLHMDSDINRLCYF